MLTSQQHIELLKSRGLQILDDEKATTYIYNIGYFRLSAYFYPLLQSPKENHIYKEGATFKQVLDMYRFDRKFRLLLFNEIEKIEIAVRSCMVNMVSETLDDIFWMTNPIYFNDINKFQFVQELVGNEIRKSREDFIQHFSLTYSDSYPPAWMVAEILPLGTLCGVYMNLKNNVVKKKIAQHFGLQAPVFSSWMNILAGLRNMCCHHSRTWNKELPICSVEPKQVLYPWINSQTIDKRRMYYRICMIKYLLFTISPNNSFKSKLLELFSKYPSVDIRAIGFPINWELDLVWK